MNIQEGNPRGKTVVIVDDLVQTGGTLYECGAVLKAQGAKVRLARRACFALLVCTTGFFFCHF